MNNYKLSYVSQLLSSLGSILVVIIFTQKFGIESLGVFSIYNAIAIILYSFFNGSIVVPYSTSQLVNKEINVYDYTVVPLTVVFLIALSAGAFHPSIFYIFYIICYLFREVSRACQVFKKKFHLMILSDTIVLLLLLCLFFVEITERNFILLLSASFLTMTLPFLNVSRKFILFFDKFKLIKSLSFYSFSSGGVYEVFNRGYNFILIYIPGGEYLNGMLNLTRTFYGLINMLCNAWGRVARINYSEMTELKVEELNKTVFNSFLVGVFISIATSIVSFYLLPIINEDVKTDYKDFLIFWSIFSCLFIMKYVLSTIAQGLNMYKYLASGTIIFCSLIFVVQLLMLPFNNFYLIIYPILICEVMIATYLYKGVRNLCK